MGYPLSLEPKEVAVIPRDILFKVVQWPFDYKCMLSLNKAIEVMSVTLLRMLDAQQIMQCLLREWNRFIHGIQIIRIHGSNQGANQMKSLDRQDGTLAPQNFNSLTAIGRHDGQRKNELL